MSSSTLVGPPFEFRYPHVLTPVAEEEDVAFLAVAQELPPCLSTLLLYLLVAVACVGLLGACVRPPEPIVVETKEVGSHC